jgi:hypothetical protein
MIVTRKWRYLSWTGHDLNQGVTGGPLAGQMRHGRIEAR